MAAAPKIEDVGSLSGLPAPHMPAYSYKPIEVGSGGLLQRSTHLVSKNPVVSYLSGVYYSLMDRRAALGLPNPGKLEDVAKEVGKDTFLTNYQFTGLRADLTRGISFAPVFQLSHALAIGSQYSAPYTYAAVYATNDVLMQGSVDSDAAVMGKLHYRVADGLVSKLTYQAHPSQGQIVQLEQDFVGPDFTVNLKAMNPSILDNTLTGIVTGSYLQSLTPSLSLGLEAAWSRQAREFPPDAALNYVGRYVGQDWVASAQLQAQGTIRASFWRKITEHVETGVECNLSLVPSRMSMMMGGASGPEGVTTIGARFDFRESTFRGQIDSTGKVACLVEKRLAPILSVVFSGEIDHSKNTAKVGMGLQLESGGDESAIPPDPSMQVKPPM
ncbi:eukaryotic porin-domain-containing protein [Dipodascopsis tothii]|uniref:eukaryotic porin-domain-containing protein n=1 Tax=Dipodascopsis tothii TaxID=44089 RepID=UPI0034CEA96F